MKCNNLYLYQLSDKLSKDGLVSNKYSATVDGKGVSSSRPLLKEMGDALESLFVVEKDVYDACLNLYPHATWLTR